MIIFKEKTHSLINPDLLNGKEDFILGLLSGGAGIKMLEGLDKDRLNDIFSKLPEPLRNKIERGDKLSVIDKNTESEILQQEYDIRIRPTFSGESQLDRLNRIYRENNPVGKINTYNNSPTRDRL